MSDNKIKFGLKNVHYSVITENNGVITYGTPKKIPGAVNLKMPPIGGKTELRADDILYYRGENNEGYEGDLEIALIPDEFKKDCLGEKVAAGNEIIYEINKPEIKPFALLFEINGDKKAGKYGLYFCYATRPELSSSTKKPDFEPQLEVLKITSIPGPNGVVKGKRYRGAGETDNTYDNWFTTVTLPVETAQ